MSSENAKYSESHRIKNSRARLSKRQDQRRLVNFRIANGLVTRQRLTPDEISELVNDIEKNNTSRFGIVRMSVYELNEFYSNPKRCTDLSSTSTIIRLAARLSRDSIVSSLIRAGADVTAYPCVCNITSNNEGDGFNKERFQCSATNGAPAVLQAYVSKKLQLLPKPVQVYLLKTLVQLRLAFTNEGLCTGRISTNDYFCCQHCEKSEQQTSPTSAEGVHCRANPDTREFKNCTCGLIMFKTNKFQCGHICCEECFWRYAVPWTVKNNENNSKSCSRSSSSSFSRGNRYFTIYEPDIECPVCNSEGNISASTTVTDTSTATGVTCGDRERENSSLCSGIGVGVAACFTVGGTQCHSHESVKKKSQELYDALPDDVPDGCQGHDARYDDGYGDDDVEAEHTKYKIIRSDAKTKTKKSKKVKFRAMSWAQCAQYLLGTVKSQRDEELLKAATSGNCLRLKALVEAGVNIDIHNEYGHSALYISAWRGHITAVKLLVAAGADPVAADNMGVSASAVAAMNHHYAIAAMLLPLCLHTDMDTLYQKALVTVTQLSHVPISNNLSIHLLIPFNAAHPGAGSMYIDGAFDSSFLSKLKEAHARLPVAEKEPQRAQTECATRSYFCDTEGWVRTGISNVLEQIQTKLCESNREADTVTVDEAEIEVRGLENYFNKMKIEESNDERGVKASAQKGLKHLRHYSSPTGVLPHMRFLCYDTLGGGSAPHIDLSRKLMDDPTRSSTHTFLLYLSDAPSGSGGRTKLLRKLTNGLRDEGEGGGEGEGEATPVVGEDAGKMDTTEPLAKPENNVIAAVEPKLGRLLIFPHVCPHEGERVSSVTVPKLLLRGELG